MAIVMEMEVEVRDRQRLIKIDRRWIENQLRKAARLLTSEALRGSLRRRAGWGRMAEPPAVRTEVSVLLVNDSQMRDLNLRYRGLDKTTDVLSFPQESAGASARRKSCPPRPGGGPFPPQALLGDIVINLHQAEREAVARDIALRQEVSRLLVHGLLHLLGYDHEAGGSEARRMRGMERRLLGGLK